MIVVPTIRNSGTHFLLDLLGIKPKGMLWTEQENGIAYGHIYLHLKDIYLPLIRDNLTIIPLRHPLVVAKSWQDRGGNILELIESWELLVNEIDPLGPMYLPIDATSATSQCNQPLRKIALENINYRTGLNLETDWEPVSSVNGNHNLRHEGMKGDKLMVDLVDRISGFLGRFY